MQNDFLHPNGFFANRPEIPGTIDQMQSTVPYIQGLIETARKAHVPVIYTKGYEDVRFRKGPDLRRAAKWMEDDQDPDGINSKQGSWGSELYEGIDPLPTEIVVEKHKWSGFDGKDKEGKELEVILQEKGIRTLVIAGVVAETCVETTIRDAYDRDYFIVVPKNSVGSNQEDQLKVRMEYWDAGFIGDVLDEAEIKEYWPAVEEESTTSLPS